MSGLGSTSIMRASRITLILGVSAALSGLTACAETPVAATPDPAAEPAIATTPPADVDAPGIIKEPLPRGNEALISTCESAPDSKPKSKPRPKPLAKPAPPQPQTASLVKEVAQGGVIDADVKPMSESVVSILGKKVQGPHGEDLGRVVDVLADASGRVRVAIIDFGGFLGVGNRRIAVDWPLLNFNPEDKDRSLILSLSREKLQNAPEYKDSTHPQALMVPPSTTAAAIHAEGKQ